MSKTLGVFHRPTMRDAAIRAGASNGLVLCLDPADHQSYTSGQSWLDTSGNGYDFFLGSTSGSDASDPTFNGLGTIGGKSRHDAWNVVGAQYFTYDTTNEAWMTAIHQDSALFTIGGWAYFPTLAANCMLMGNAGGLSGSRTGFFWKFTSTTAPQFQVFNNNANVLTVNGTALTPGWNFVALSVDEAAGTGFLVTNDLATAITSTYSTPSAGAASFTTQIAAGGNNTFNSFPAGSLLGPVAAWTVSLTASQLLSLYNAMLPRYRNAA